MLPSQAMLFSARPLVQKFMILTSGGFFTVPSDWNSSNNKVHCIGAGGNGTTSGAGGGGAYAMRNNVVLTPGASQAYKVGNPGSTFSDTDTRLGAFNNELVKAAGSVGSGGGPTNTSEGDIVFAGGDGTYSLGGGGAGGPHGAGQSGTTGGLGDAGQGGVTIWTDSTTGATAGSGNGGTSRTGRNGVGDPGGNYGGGGGGGGSSGSGASGGAGAGGVIVLEWWA